MLLTAHLPCVVDLDWPQSTLGTQLEHTATSTTTRRCISIRCEDDYDNDTDDYHDDDDEDDDDVTMIRFLIEDSVTL